MIRLRRIMGLSRLRRMSRDQRGATLVEFGFVGPVLVLMLMGIFDIGFQLYTRSVLLGELQKAGRDSTLETGKSTSATIDAAIETQVKRVAKNATFTFKRRAYQTLSDAAAARAEDFTDSSSGTYRNGRCDNGEPYVDANLNETWDSDGGDEGQGGAKDVSIVTVTVTYDRLFPLAKLIGLPEQITIAANTVLANQPYAEQAAYAAPQTRNCDD